MSILQSLRQRNLFGGGGGNSFNPRQLFQPQETFGGPFRGQGNAMSYDMQPPQVQEPKEDPSFLMKYMRALENAPQRENPSKWRKFGAALAGGLAGYGGSLQEGIQTGNNFLDAPYNRKLEDHKLNLQHLGAGAELETSMGKQNFEQFIELLKAEREGRDVDSNVALRQAQGGKARAETLDTLGETPNAQASLAKIKADIDKINAEVEANPANIANLEARTRQINQQIEQSDLSDSEKLELQGEINKSVASIYANARGTSADGELEQTRRRDNELRRIANDPALMAEFKDFIDVRNSRGDITINLKPPTRRGFGRFSESDADFQARVAVYDRLRQRIGEIPRSGTQLPNDVSGGNEAALDYLRQNHPSLTNPTPEDIEWAMQQMGGG